MKVLSSFNTRAGHGIGAGNRYIPGIYKEFDRPEVDKSIPKLSKALLTSLKTVSKGLYKDFRIRVFIENDYEKPTIDWEIKSGKDLEGNEVSEDDILSNISLAKLTDTLNSKIGDLPFLVVKISNEPLGPEMQVKRRKKSPGKVKKVTSSLKQKASENPIYQLIDYDGDTILTHTLVDKEHIIKNASGKVVARLPLNEDGSDFAYNKIVLGDKVGIAEILGAIINNSFVSNKIIIKER